MFNGLNDRMFSNGMHPRKGARMIGSTMRSFCFESFRLVSSEVDDVGRELIRRKPLLTESNETRRRVLACGLISQDGRCPGGDMSPLPRRCMLGSCIDYALVAFRYIIP